MKKLLLGLLLLLLIIPTTVSASGFLSLVPFINGKVDVTVEVEEKGEKSSACEFGFWFDFAMSECVEVVVPEHGVLDEEGHSFHCEFGYKRSLRANALKKNLDDYVCEKVILPEHATISGSGDDFICDRDYFRASDENPLEQCHPLVIPSNAQIAPGGNDFACNTGFRRDGDKCVDAVKPDHAKFLPNSDDWYCESGFKKSDDGKTCEELIVPANAKRSETGTFWYCYQGFRLTEDGQHCERVVVPSHAEPNWIGGWDCNQGYRKAGDTCEKVELPDDAKFFTRGAEIFCEPSYVLDIGLNKCVRITLPDNAEYDDSSYLGWRCKQGFVKNVEGRRCDQFKLSEHAFWVGFNSWDCDAGYKKIGNNCEKVSIPEHAHASSSNDRWDCDAGYTKNYHDNKCESI